MSQLNLPDHPDLSHLRRQAKSLRDRVRRGDQQAIDQVSDHHPEARALVPLLGAEGTSPPFALADAQLTLSRAYGFPSWPALRRHVDEVHRLTRRPHLAPLGTGADRLLRLACLDYGSTTRGSSAEAAVLLAADPSLSARAWPRPPRPGICSRLARSSRRIPPPCTARTGHSAGRRCCT